MNTLAKDWRALVAGVVCLTNFAVSDATAQFGSISGKITDDRGEPIRHANVWVPGTYCVGLSDDTGEYVLPIVPAGPRNFSVTASGFISVENPKVIVKIGRDARIDFVLAPDSQMKDHKVPWWRRKGETTAARDTLNNAQRDSILEAIALRAGVFSDEITNEGHIDPVQWRGIEFDVRYSLEIHGDSTIVRVVANGTNVSTQSKSVCGAYAFVHAPHSLDIDGAQRFYTSPTIGCETQELLPGDCVSDSLRFSYLTATYDNRRGSVHLWCWFFQGNDGFPWEETDFVELGILDIRLGRPSN